MTLNKETKQKCFEYFLRRLGMFEYRNGWLKGDCPECGAELKYGVNLDVNRTNCFKCGYHDRPLWVIKKVENLNFLNEVKVLLGSFEGLEYRETAVKKLERKQVDFPLGYKPLLMGDSQLAKSARAYVKGRGFNVEEMASKGWGYGTEDPYFGYLILPYFEKEKLVYYSTRSFIDIGPKFNNPPVENFGIGKSQLIYNRDALYIYDRVHIVESITNAETIGDNAIAIGGKKISNYQFNLILKSPVSRVNIILDPDAIEEALQFGLRLCNYKKVKVVELPQGFDVNELGRKKTFTKIHKFRYEQHQELLKRKINL